MSYIAIGLVGRITTRKYDQLAAELENQQQKLKKQLSFLTPTSKDLANYHLTDDISFSKCLQAL